MTTERKERALKSTSNGWHRYLRNYTEKSRPLLIYIGSIIIVSSVLALSVPYAIRVLFDAWGEDAALDKALALSSICVLVMLLKYVLDYHYKTIAAKSTSRIFADMVKDLYSHMLSLGMDFYIGTKSGEFMQSFDQDMYVIVRMIMNDFISLFASTIQVLLMLAFISFINPALMLISVAFTPAYYVLKRSADHRSKRANAAMIKSWGDASSDIHESLIGIKAIKESNAEDYCVSKNDERLNNVSGAFFGLEKQNAKTSVIASMFTQIVPFFVMLLGVVFYKARGLSAGEVIAFFYVVIGFFAPLGTIVVQSNNIQKCRASIERVDGLFSVESNVRETGNPKTGFSLRGKIALEGVNFAYGEKGILRSIDATIEPGERVAIVGPSGSGKTTLLSLLYRLYDPKEGVVRIDDVDIKEYGLRELRKQIGYVGQETILFHTSVRENLRIANARASDEEMRRACEVAGIHDEILRTERGYETIIGEKGMKLSGGQRQRIAIARMLLKRPSIVIFDESFSNIDSESEHAFFENARDGLLGKTCLIISHRLSSVIDADRVLFLEGGEIIDRGPHGELFDRNIHYRELWKNQARIRSA